MEEIKNGCYKGTRIVLGNEKGLWIARMKARLIKQRFTEIHLPIIHPYLTFKDKVGEENNNMMFNFEDRGGRSVCLAPEYTSVVQNLASTRFKYDKNVMLFYVAECFRAEKPQKGRFRQFTQLGVELLNPTQTTHTTMLMKMASSLLNCCDCKDFVLTTKVDRAMDFYKENTGFEINIPKYGTASQIVGGGSYEGGTGFAIGVDRLLSLSFKDERKLIL